MSILVRVPLPADFQPVVGASPSARVGADGHWYISIYAKYHGVAGQYVIKWTVESPPTWGYSEVVALQKVTNARGSLSIAAGELWLFSFEQNTSSPADLYVQDVPGFVAIPGEENAG